MGCGRFVYSAMGPAALPSATAAGSIGGQTSADTCPSQTSVLSHPPCKSTSNGKVASLFVVIGLPPEEVGLSLHTRRVGGMESRLAPLSWLQAFFIPFYTNFICDQCTKEFVNVLQHEGIWRRWKLNLCVCSLPNCLLTNFSLVQ